MVLAMVVDVAIVLGATGLTFLLPRRAAGHPAAGAAKRAPEYSAGPGH